MRASFAIGLALFWCGASQECAAQLSGDRWANASPEEKIADYISRIWITQQSSTVDCGDIIFARKAGCVAARAKIRAEAFPNGPCKVLVRENFPVEYMQRSWDGQIIGRYLLGREISLNLRGVDQAKIRPGIDVYLPLQGPYSSNIRLRYSDSPEWVTIPSPPAMIVQSPQGGSIESQRAVKGWFDVAAPGFNSPSVLPIFQAEWLPSDLNDRQPIERKLLHLQVRFSTQATYSDFMEVSQANNEFLATDRLLVSIVKSAIAKCETRN